MIKPKDVLKVARWWKPDGEWEVRPAGTVYSVQYGNFSLNERNAIQSVTMKLQQEHGWRVSEVTRSGQPHWKADNGKGGTAESPSLQKLLVVLVDRVSGSEGRG